MEGGEVTLHALSWRHVEPLYYFKRVPTKYGVYDCQCPYPDCRQVFQVARGENCNIKQVPQRESEAECDRLRQKRVLYGYARPFMLTPNDTTVTCDYNVICRVKKINITDNKICPAVRR